ncbi:MAG: OmpA family protein [Maribacter sp.]
MTKTTTNLLLMLITIVGGTYFYSTCCSECGNVTSTEIAAGPLITEAPEYTSFPFSVYGNGFSYSTNDNYNFNSSSPTILLPLSQELTAGINELQRFLESNETSVLNVTGYYKSDEVNNSVFPNLGIARANAIKNDLASKGISTAQINTMGKVMDEMFAVDTIYRGAAFFSIEKKSNTDEAELKALYDGIKTNPLILYFNTAAASINLDMEQREKVADISKYLDKVDGAKANIVGHTDTTGKATTNMQLGLDRANFAKQYFIENGIPESKIVVSSKGQTEPIAQNTTEEGKNQNRRTVITLN